MADPSVRSVGARVNSVNVTAPTTVVVGDTILISLLMSHIAGVDAVPSLSGFAYEAAYSTTTSGEDATGYLWKIADSSDVALAGTSSAYTISMVTGSIRTQFAQAIQDADPTTPIRSVAGAKNPSASFSTPAVSLPSLTGGDLLIWHSGRGNNHTISTMPTGSTRLTPTASAQLHSASLTQASGGSSISFVGSGASLNQIYYVGLVAIKADTSSHIPVLVDFAGEGTLTATATVRYSSAAAFSGSGSLTATVGIRYARAAAFAGSGSLTATTLGRPSIAASLSGTGALSATAAAHYSTTADFSGAGTLTGASREHYAVTAGLSGSGSLTAVARLASTQAQLTGVGTLSATATARYGRSAALSGSGSLTAVTASRLRLAVTGTRVSPTLDLSNIIDVTSSAVTWDADLPAGTSMTVETSIDGGGSWQTVLSNGGTIPGITTGLDLTGMDVQTRLTLNGDGFATPEVHSLSVTVTQAKVSHFENSGVPDNNRFNLGVYILTTPDRPVGETPTTYQVQGYDKLYLLTHEVGDTYTIGTGTGFIAAVRQVIADSGVTGLPPLIDSTLQGKALQAPMVWHGTETPTTWLRIINDLLAAISYRGLWVDADGRFRSEPYLRPQDRSPEWSFDMTALHTDIVSEDRTYKQDAFERLNWWRFIRDASATTPTEGDGMFTIDRTNGDARRPKVVKLTAADQASLESQGNRIFAEDTQRTSSWDIKTGPLPVLGHFDIATLNDPELGDFKVQSTGHSIPLDGGDVTLTLEVVT